MPPPRCDSMAKYHTITISPGPGTAQHQTGWRHGATADDCHRTGLRLRAVQISGLRRRASRVALGLETRVAAPVSSRRIERWIEDCEPLLRTSARRRNVVILASARQRRAALACVRHFKDDRVLVLGVQLPPMPGVASREAADLDAIYDEIRQFGTVNVLIDLRPVDVAAHRESWERPDLPPGPRRRLRSDASRAAVLGARRRTSSTWAAALSSPVAPDSAVERSRRGAFSGVVMLDHVFVVRKKGQHFLAVGDDEVEAVLPDGSPR